MEITAEEWTENAHQRPLAHRECSISRATAEQLGATIGAQVRIEEETGSAAGAYTVTSIDNHDQDLIFNPVNSAAWSSDPTVEAHVFTTVPRTDLPRSEARKRGDVTETVWHDRGLSPQFVVCAPHAGNMERNTARMATITARSIGTNRCSAWLVEHFQPDPFDDWHITSTRIHPRSYPGLERIASVNFERAVSFHLYDGRDQPVIVGGRANKQTRDDLADRIEQSISHMRSVITQDGKHMGDTKSNFVNWLTTDGDSGIQIELPPLVIKEKSVQVANAVASFLIEQG